ncbi:hypothetical protein BFL43_27380 [Williamsia sp. 1135]|nr:hypothetical protein BFL43_27380 [Williamsia sp. 1135]
MPRWILPLVAMICVLAVATATVVVWQSVSGGGSEPTKQPPLAGQLTSEYPSAPIATSEVSATQLGADQFVSVLSAENQYLRPGFVHDDSTVVTMTANQGSSDHSLVGVVVEAGEQWVSPVRPRACADRIVDHQMVCNDAGSVYFIDTLTGRATHTVPLDGGMGYGLAYDGDNAYVVSATTGDKTITQVTPTGRGWSQTYPSAGALPSGDSTTTLATDSLVATASGSVTVASTVDGRVLVNRPGGASISTLADGSILVVAGSFSNGQVSRGPVLVVRPDGSVDEVDGDSVATPAVSNPGESEWALIGGRLVDSRSGVPRWQVPVASGTLTPNLSLLTAQQAVVVDGDGARVHSIDTTTGVERWSAGTIRQFGENVGVTDGQRYIYVGPDNGIVAADLATGAPQWSLPTSPGGSVSVYAGPQILAVGDHLVVATPGAITVYNPTGGAASAPGEPGTTDQAAGNGDDEYVTRCGSAPVFEPQRFATSAGGLVVTMKVTATCPTGDVLSSGSTRITITQGAALVASGLFDFSRSVLALPPGRGADRPRSIDLDMTFSPGSFLRLPDTLPSGSGAAGTTYLVECEQVGGPGTLTEAPAPAGGASAAAVSASSPFIPQDVDVEAVCRRCPSAASQFGPQLHPRESEQPVGRSTQLEAAGSRR